MNKRESSSQKYIDVTCAIIKRGSKILIAKRSSISSHPGKWEFPGGKIEPDDQTLESCLARELKEELGIIVTVGKLFLRFEQNYGRPDGKQHRFHSFECQVLAGQPQPYVHDRIMEVSVRELRNFDFVKADKQLFEALLIS